MSNKLIKVEFIDAQTGQLFGRTESPPEMLPETFELDTNLKVAGQDWNVVRAEPMTRVEYVKSEKLVLTLQRIQMMRPQDILYSLPTICDALPAVDTNSTTAGKNVLWLHEDSWRQVEFISNSKKPEVIEELNAIVRIHQQHQVGVGFNQIHIRQNPVIPLSGNFTVQQLKASLKNAVFYDSVAYERSPHVIKNAFAFGYGKLAIYGLEDVGKVQMLGMEILPDGSLLSFQPLIELANDHDLVLIDWCRVRPVTPEKIEDYFAKILS